jgi:hypothetical protein
MSPANSYDAPPNTIVFEALNCGPAEFRGFCFGIKIIIIIIIIIIIAIIIIIIPIVIIIITINNNNK